MKAFNKTGQRLFGCYSQPKQFAIAHILKLETYFDSYQVNNENFID